MKKCDIVLSKIIEFFFLKKRVRKIVKYLIFEMGCIWNFTTIGEQN